LIDIVVPKRGRKGQIEKKERNNTKGKEMVSRSSWGKMGGAAKAATSKTEEKIANRGSLQNSEQGDSGERNSKGFA